MTYADYSYYCNGYLLGKESAIPEKEFLYWEKQARSEVDTQTFDRVKNLNEIPEAVKDCTCAVAEVLYTAEQVKKTSAAAGAAGPLVSYSNDGQSGTFVNDTSGIYTESGKQQVIKQLIRKYLIHTGLLYCGVSRCES